MPERKNCGRVNWINLAVWGGVAVLSLTFWGLSLIGAAYLLGLLP